MSTKDEVTALETRRCEAIAAGDIGALADVLADDYVHVLAPGRTVDKNGYLEMIRNRPRQPVRGALNVRIYGSAAVVSGDLENSIGPPDAVQRVIPAFCTQVAVRHDDGNWRFVSYILTQKREG